MCNLYIELFIVHFIMITRKIQIITIIISLISAVVLATSAWTLVYQKAAAITCENFLSRNPPHSSSEILVPLTADERTAVCHGITPAQESVSHIHITHGGLSNYHGDLLRLEKSFTVCTQILKQKSSGVDLRDVNSICTDLNPPE
jgi:hypothetical protein